MAVPQGADFGLSRPRHDTVRTAFRAGPCLVAAPDRGHSRPCSTPPSSKVRSRIYSLATSLCCQDIIQLLCRRSSRRVEVHQLIRRSAAADADLTSPPQPRAGSLRKLVPAALSSSTVSQLEPSPPERQVHSVVEQEADRSEIETGNPVKPPPRRAPSVP